MTGEILVADIAKIFRSPRGDVEALRSLTFTASPGEFVAILGPSGCGKSTLLRLIAGLAAPDSGSVSFPGWPRKPACRLVFQDHALFPWMTVLDNVAFGLEMDGVPLPVRRKSAYAQLESMGMGKFAGLFPHELSGGMRQRAAIARAFVTFPDILLMDEPLRALDAQLRLVVQEELLGIWGKRKPMVIYVTHDIEEALLLADRILIMSGRPGRILHEFCPPFGRPRDLTGCAHPELEEMKWVLWNLLEKDVRGTLASQPPAGVGR